MFFKQIRQHWVALMGVLVALLALSYTAWRNETTEVNRSIRAASFEIVRELGALQTVVHYAFYGQNQKVGDPITGWQHVILIKDLALLVPSPIPSDTIIAAIDEMRNAVLLKLKSLH